jgi:hypothetical protein
VISADGDRSETSPIWVWTQVPDFSKPSWRGRLLALQDRSPVCDGLFGSNWLPGLTAGAAVGWLGFLWLELLASWALTTPITPRSAPATTATTSTRRPRRPL